MKRKFGSLYYGAYAAAAGVKAGKKLYDQWKRSNPGKGGGGNGKPPGASVRAPRSSFVDQYHSTRGDYRRRRAPRRLKRRIRKFNKKVQRVIDTNNGLHTFTKVESGGTALSPIGTNVSQSVIDISLSGFKPAASVSYNDVAILNALETGQTAIASAYGNVDNIYEMISRRMELTVVNSHATKHLLFDVYTWKCRRDSGNDFSTTWSAGYGQSVAAPALSGAFRTDITAYGATPFDVSTIGEYFIIEKVQHVMLGAGLTWEYTFKDPKNKLMPMKELLGSISENKVGWSRGWTIIFYGESHATTQDFCEPFAFGYIVNKTYRYKKNGDETVKTYTYG